MMLLHTGNSTLVGAVILAAATTHILVSASIEEEQLTRDMSGECSKNCPLVVDMLHLRAGLKLWGPNWYKHHKGEGKGRWRKFS